MGCSRAMLSGRNEGSALNTAVVQPHDLLTVCSVTSMASMQIKSTLGTYYTKTALDN